MRLNLFRRCSVLTTVSFHCVITWKSLTITVKLLARLGFLAWNFSSSLKTESSTRNYVPLLLLRNTLFQEVGSSGKRKKDVHFTKHSHTLFSGWLISQTMGFFAAFRLFLNIFKPTLGPATAHSFDHMDKISGADHREQKSRRQRKRIANRIYDRRNGRTRRRSFKKHWPCKRFCAARLCHRTRFKQCE